MRSRGTERKLIIEPIKEGDMGKLCLGGNILVYSRCEIIHQIAHDRHFSLEMGVIVLDLQGSPTSLPEAGVLPQIALTSLQV